jgi:hypothetical protein
MKIDKSHTTPTYAQGAGSPRRDTPSSSSATPSGASSSDRVRPDRVEISPDGRALAERATMSAERLAEVRARIQTGHYDSPAVADAVARKLAGRLGG